MYFIVTKQYALADAMYTAHNIFVNLTHLDLYTSGFNNSTKAKKRLMSKTTLSHISKLISICLHNIHLRFSASLFLFMY